MVTELEKELKRSHNTLTHEGILFYLDSLPDIIVFNERRRTFLLGERPEKKITTI